MIKKFELTTNTRIKFGRTLYQIKALISFGKIKAGDLGGWVEHEESLSHEQLCWIEESADVFRNARVIHDGVIRGGVIWDGVIRGGVIHDGVIRGGEIWGGVIRGGEIRGGVIRGGVIHDGVIRGGEIWGGEIRASGDIIFITSIGSRVAPLTAYKNGKDIEVTTGCFCGTLKDFTAQVKNKHGKNQYAKEYELAIKLITLKLKKAKKDV